MSKVPSKNNLTLETPTEEDNIELMKPKHVKKYKQNWRINQLAIPRVPREKYNYPPDVFDSGVPPGALKYELQDRVEHMSRPPLRTLVLNKKQYKSYYNDYETRMDKRIESSWNSIYNCYKKARRDLSIKSSTSSRHSRGSKHSKPSKTVVKPSKDAKVGKAGKKGKEKGGKGDSKKKDKKKDKEKKPRSPDKYVEKTEEDIEREREEWCQLRAKPKRLFEPEPIARGPIADLYEMKEHMDTLATPKKIYTTEPKDPTKINEAALIYTPTDRILELARPPAFKLSKEEPYIPGSVKPGALHAIPTDRIKELATPKVAQNPHDVDIKEDPFTISPNALKYVATERIKELAKPIER